MAMAARGRRSLPPVTGHSSVLGCRKSTCKRISMPGMSAVLILHLVLGFCGALNVDDESGNSTATKLISSSRKSGDASKGCMHLAIATEELMLNTVLCEDRSCSDACQAYLTPVNKCFNGQSLFPGDPSWGEHDVLDTYECPGRKDSTEGSTNNDGRSMNWEIMPRREEGEDEAKAAVDIDYASSFKRTLFRSKDSSCREPTDEFDTLPLNECIGPFGKPRPWGRFEIAAKM